MAILWHCLLLRQEFLKARFYVFVQIDQIACHTAVSCLMRGKKVFLQLVTKKRYVCLEASANATTTALAIIENKTGRYPETEGTPRHITIFSSLCLRDWNIPQLCLTVCSSASLTCLFLTPDSYLSSCSSRSLLLVTVSDRTAQTKQLRVSGCFLMWELFHTSEHSDCSWNPLQLVVYRSLFADSLSVSEGLLGQSLCNFQMKFLKCEWIHLTYMFPF